MIICLLSLARSDRVPLARPDANRLPALLSTIGEDYDERVMPSIVNETLKSIVAQFNANQLITQVLCAVCHA